MKTTHNNFDTSRHQDTQRGKGERRTDNTPKPEIGQKQREQTQKGDKRQPNNFNTSTTKPCLSGLYL
jgi:hypothetical protein